MCWYIAEQTTHWELPVLENIVVEGLRLGLARAQPLKALWGKFGLFGGQVRVLELELGGGGWGGMSMGDVSKTVAFCPALEELDLRVVVEDYLIWRTNSPGEFIQTVLSQPHTGSGEILP